VSKTKMLMTAIGVGILLYAACVTASSTLDAPLYTVRMEQQSSKMSFLPTAVNQFTYTAENKYTVNCDVTAWCGATPFNPLTIGFTCETCRDPTCVTCPATCLPTCPSTCSSTCPDTCDTCESTCNVTCGVSVCVCPTLIGC
jgi:hypothetical protein